MNSEIHLSIIIPVFNSGSEISFCIDSIISLRIEIPYEIIVQDGESADNTLSILTKYSDSINLEAKQDKGVYDAMNRAVARSKGTWLYFLGSDDVILPDFKKALEHLNNDLDLVYGNVKLKDSGQIYDREFSLEKLAQKNISHQAIFYKKSLLIKHGFDLKYPILADYAVNLKLFTNRALKIKFVYLTIAEFAETGLSNHTKDIAFIRDKPKILEEIFPNYKKLEGYHQALFSKAENEISKGKLSSGLNTLLKWGKITNRRARSIYLIFALLKNKYFSAGS